MRKAQLTIFVIVAFAVISLFFFMFYIKGKVTEVQQSTETKQTMQATFETAPVQTYVEQCLKTTAEKVLFDRIGIQGGYLNATGALEYGSAGAPSYLDASGLYIPYYLDASLKKYPSKADIEQNMSKYVAVELEQCLNFDSFAQFNITKPAVDYIANNFNFSAGSTWFNVSINLDDVQILVKYPLRIERAGAVTKLSDFSVVIPIHLGAIYNVTEEFIRFLDANYPPARDLDVDCPAIDLHGIIAQKEFCLQVVYGFGEGPQDYAFSVTDSDTPYKDDFTYLFAVTDTEIVIDSSCGTC